MDGGDGQVVAKVDLSGVTQCSSSEITSTELTLATVLTMAMNSEVLRSERLSL